MNAAFGRIRFFGVVVGLAASACSCAAPEGGLLDYEYQDHRVGNRAATVEELKDMQQREESHIALLQADIDRLEQQECELVTERDSREASLHLVAKDVEVARDRLSASKAELEGALAERSIFDHEHDLLRARIAKLRDDIAALNEVLQRADQQLIPDKERLIELLKGIGRDLGPAPGLPPEGPPKVKSRND
jgi:chromosome segregation ATPase